MAHLFEWQERCIALTFDDGPDPVYTPKILDLLREERHQSNVLRNPENVRTNIPEIVRRAWAEGHTCSLITPERTIPYFVFIPESFTKTEIELVVPGKHSPQLRFSPRLFRSPVGLRHPLLAPYLENAGLEYLSWSIRTLDTFTASSSVLARRILSRAATGDIILLHDHLPRGTDAMLEALPQVIDELRERGFEFVLAAPREDAGGTLEPTTCEPVP